MEYEPNSYRSRAERAEKKEEREKVEKVVTGKVTRKKKNELSKIGDAFISEDAHSVGSYLLEEVIMPGIKNTFADIVIDGITMLLFGETKISRRNSDGSGGRYTPYGSRYNNSVRYSDRNRIRTGYDFDEIIISTKGEAYDVLDQMEDILERYGVVRVADLYELVGEQGSYTDNKYGWKTLRGSDAVRTRDGRYILKLPKVMEID